MSTTEQTPQAIAPDAALQQLYRWSAWVHVGPGAEECESVDEATGTNDCSNPLHFHAWCRLPNPLQHRDIRESALAAKARRMRQLRAPDSDANVILEAQLDEIARRGDDAKDDLVEELVAKDWWRDYMEAQADMRELEAGADGERPYQHIERDMTRWQELAAMPENTRPADEYAELEAHITAYNAALDEKRTEIASPRRESLMARDLNELLDMVREQRIDIDSNEHFSNEYATLEWLHCTLRSAPSGAPVFGSMDALRNADAVVIDALKDTFGDLERTQASDHQGGGPGNS